MRLPLLISFILFSHYTLLGQRTRQSTEQGLPLQSSLAAFRQGKIEEGCLLVERVMIQQPTLFLQNQDSETQEFRYFSIVCQLIQADKKGEDNALQFLVETTVQSWKDRIRFYLGNYYFYQQNWIAALNHYILVSVANLSNSEIATMQFHQGYSHFVLKQYVLAKPLLNSIHQLPEGVYKPAASYYYGLILFGEGSMSEAMSCFQQVESDPKFGKLSVYYSSQIMMARGEAEQVINYLEKNASLFQDTSYPSAARNQVLGHAYFVKADFSKALPLLSSYVNTGSGVSRVDQYELAFSQFKLKQFSDAINNFKKLTDAKDTIAAYSLFYLGESYLARNNKKEARSAYSLCMQSAGKKELQSAAQLNFSKLSYELGYFDEAVRELESYIRNNPSSYSLVEAQELLFASLAASSNYKRALQVLEQIAAPSSQTQLLTPSVRFGRAVELFYDGDLSETKKLLLRIINDKWATSMQGEAHFWLGEVCYLQKEYATAILYYNKYLSSGGVVSGEASPIHAHYNLGYSYLNLSQYKLALGQFEKVRYGIQSGNTSLELDARLRSADCQLLLRQYKYAKQLYQTFVDIDAPAAPYAFFQLATIAGIDNVGDKIRLLKELIVRFPQSSYVLSSKMGLADAYMEGERFRDALPVLEDLLQNAGIAEQPSLLFKMAVVHYNLDENEKALLYYQRLFEQYPKSAEAADALEELKAVYVDLGRATEYTTYLKTRGIAVSVNLEDSLQYLVAEQQFDAKDYMRAIPSFQQYLNQFPKGKYYSDAQFRLASSYYLRKEWEQAVVPLEELLNTNPGKYQFDATFMLARIYYFELKKIDKASYWYEQLLPLTVKMEDRLEIFRALLRTNYQQKNWAVASQFGDSLITYKEKSKEDQALSVLAKAKQYFVDSKEMEGQQLLAGIPQLNKAALAAEARYELALSHFRLQQWNLAEKMAFETINKSGSYEWWVTKSYLLLGDIYLAQKDYFNAQATYQSVYENASDPALRNEALEKIAVVKKNEKGN
jgi:TolA-binding protein